MSLLIKKSRLLSECLVLCCVFFFPRMGLAQESVTDTLKRQITDMQEQLKRALDRIDQLEKEKSTTSGKIDQLESAAAARIGQVEQSVRGVQGAPSLFNPAIGMVIDATG